jgi:hypothetical protein
MKHFSNRKGGPVKSLAIRFSLFVLVLAVLPVNGFGKRHELPQDPKFAAIDQIVILPVVDARASKEKEKIDINKINKWLRGSAERVLKKKNYSVSLADSTGQVGEIQEEDLTDSKPEWVNRLGVPEARWVMVVGINDVHSKTTFGSSGNAEIFGFLYDKQDGSTVWKGTAIGRFGQGGLLGMAMKGAMSESAIQTAATNLLSELPKHPKK